MIIHNKATAVLLAGGLGTRLRSVVEDKPKVMAQVNGRPFLEYLLNLLVDNGIQKTIVCTGYKGDQIREYFGHSYRNTDLLYSHEHEPLGTGGALRLAAKHLGNEAALVLNGDSFCKFNLDDFAAYHSSKKAIISIAIAQVLDVSRYGAVEISTSGIITGFTEKGHNRGVGLINAGVYLIEREAIDSIPLNTHFSLERELFPRHRGNSLYGYSLCHDFIDIGIPEDYAAAQHFFR